MREILWQNTKKDEWIKLWNEQINKQTEQWLALLECMCNFCLQSLFSVTHKNSIIYFFSSHGAKNRIGKKGREKYNIAKKYSPAYWIHKEVSTHG